MQMNMLNDFTLTQRQLAEIARQLLPGVQLLLFCRAGGIGGLSVVKRTVLLAAAAAQGINRARRDYRRQPGQKRVSGIVGMAHAMQREQHILTERRLTENPQTLEELSQVYDVGRERIRQIEVRAFEKVQKAMQRIATERLMPVAA